MRIKSIEDLVQVELLLSFAGQQLAVSVFFIDGLLIDTGPAKMKKQLIPIFNEWNINKVILTHHHEDHTGMASWIQKNKGIPIYIHELGIKNCEKRIRLPLYRKVFWGEGKPFQPVPLERVVKTPHYTWDVIYTPGHAHDHVVLYNREKRWMFGGDLYVQPNPKSLFSFESVPIMIQSLRKILTYDFDTYICSHAGVILKGKRAIEEKLHYLERIQQEVLALNKEGKSPYQIRRKLFPKRHPMNYLSFFDNSPQHIVNSILK